MTALKSGVSRCGLCRFYNHEGRRGGTCSQLNVPVAAKWNACGLSASPFESGNQREGAIAAQQNRWLVPETASELMANPRVVNSTGNSAAHHSTAQSNLAES